ncbi:uncharacterized protein LOC142771367 [Rhipicephalus microplus]|uniref:uncharacterized protein LOC142771367 n=1 Tax=Rhipicephalus microplus TaxID=6941 RepID=UPI003F6D3B84
MGKPKQPKSDEKGKGSAASKDRTPSKETKSKEVKTPDSAAASPSKRGPYQGDAGFAWPPPLNRPMMAPLLLPSDYLMDEPRRPSKIYVWDWGNVWFFPMSVLAISVIVFAMVLMWIDSPNQNTYGRPSNTTSFIINDTSNATEEDSPTTLHEPQHLLPDQDEKCNMSTELEEEEAAASTSRTHNVPGEGARATTASPKTAGPKAVENPRKSKQGSWAGLLKSSASSFTVSETGSGKKSEENSMSPAQFLGTSKNIYGSSVRPSVGLVASSTTRQSPIVKTSTLGPPSGSTKNYSDESSS